MAPKEPEVSKVDESQTAPLKSSNKDLIVKVEEKELTIAMGQLMSQREVEFIKSLNSEAPEISQSLSVREETPDLEMSQHNKSNF